MESIDMLFTGFVTEGSAYVPAPRSYPGATISTVHPQQSARPVEFTPTPFPEGEQPNVKAAHEWLANEKRKLEEYTRSQFGTIQQQHQALLAKHFRSEEALALRAQELNREMQFLASQSEAMQQCALGTGGA